MQREATHHGVVKARGVAVQWGARQGDSVVWCLLSLRHRSRDGGAASGRGREQVRYSLRIQGGEGRAQV